MELGKKGEKKLNEDVAPVDPGVILEARIKLLKERGEIHDDRAISALEHAEVIISHGGILHSACELCEAIRDPQKYFGVPW